MITAETHSKKELENQLVLLNDTLQKRDENIIYLNQGITDRDQTIHYLKEQLDWFKRQIFGKRSERVVSDLNSRQLTFEGFENLQTPVEEPEKTIAAHSRP